MKLKYTRAIGQRNFFAYIKGIISGRLNALSAKIDMYHSRGEGLLLEKEEQEMTNGFKQQGHSEKMLNRCAEIYSRDPENKEALFIYGETAIDLYIEELEKEHEQELDKEAGLSDYKTTEEKIGKSWQKALDSEISYCKRMIKKIKDEYKKVEELSYFSDLLSNEEREFIKSNLIREGDEYKYYKEGMAFGEGGGYGLTPLLSAAFSGETETLKLLLKEGADVNAKGENGWAPLHMASFKAHIEIIKHLIENGADVNIMGSGGWTSLHIASSRDKAEVAELLIGNGAEVNIKDKHGNTPLHYKKAPGSDTAELLRRHGGKE